MKISDVDLKDLLVAISGAVAEVLHKESPAGKPAQYFRERSELTAEIMGRITAVLRVDHLGPTILDDIEKCVGLMQASYRDTAAGLLGPGGSLSKT